MPQDRDVAIFEKRALTYERGFLGRLHKDIAERTAALLVATVPSPARVLDVGCGTGYLVRLLAERYPSATDLVGVDPARSMIDIARRSAVDRRLRFAGGVGAEHLPFDSDLFDVVVSTTSFDHWRDQLVGLLECARVLRTGGRVVIVDQFSAFFAPTLLFGRLTKARTKQRARRVLERAGFHAIEWHRHEIAIPSD